MLVMRRRAGETFLIGDSIEIEILAICGARVKLGIVRLSQWLFSARKCRSLATKTSLPRAMWNRKISRLY